MINRTKKEVIKKLKEIWPSTEAAPIKVNVSLCKAGMEIRLKISSIYKTPDLSYKHLKALVDFFETDYVGDIEIHISQGRDHSCCDSEYGFIISVKDDGRAKLKNIKKKYIDRL